MFARNQSSPNIDPHIVGWPCQTFPAFDEMSGHFDLHGATPAETCFNRRFNVSTFYSGVTDKLFLLIKTALKKNITRI